jgi:hypothetical protein
MTEQNGKTLEHSRRPSLGRGWGNQKVSGLLNLFTEGRLS